MLGLRIYKGIQLDVWQGDITQFACDAMVNAAATDLQGGGGVDGAMRKVGGAELDAAIRAHGSCAAGSVVLTPGFGLPCPWVIHAVGPIWQGGTQGEPSLLASCYRQSLMVAAERGVKHLVFSSISTGVFGFPYPLASRTALETVKSILDQNRPELGQIQRITFVSFLPEHYAIKQGILLTLFDEET
jgi:O-acetyl-ADP-ribose deacetylase (regulator of RNase III)